MLEQSHLSGAKLEAVAADLCAMVFSSRTAAGGFTMRLSDLSKAAALPPDQLEAATNWAADQAWLRCGPDHVELTAAGIYVAKVTLDLPR